MKITIDALTLDQQRVRVSIDTDSARHILRHGAEVEYSALSVDDQNHADRLIDSLSDVPLFADGRVWAHRPDYNTFNAWEPAELVKEGNDA